MAPAKHLSASSSLTRPSPDASLSFPGLQPPSPSWGSMLDTARTFKTQAPWIPIFPGSAIVLIVLGFNLLGDGLRDALDPCES